MSSVYVHIPFCKTRCIYCDFYSTTSLPLRQRYVDAVCREMSLRSDYLGGATVGTIYFGGGTPSQLAADQLRQLLLYIYKVYPVADDAEVTIEMNPDDVTDAYVEALRQLPFNRVSLGIQTFDDARLRFIHRRHTAQQAVDAVRRLQSAGYDNISIDLMFGFPGQTPEQWAADIDRALSLATQHVSAYSLMYEDGTRLHSMLADGTIAEIDEEVSLAMYQSLIEKLSTAGYQHYEISNFCLPGRQSRHNSGYWNDTHYIGLGAGAHSYNGSARQWNVCDLKKYIEGAETGSLAFELEQLSDTQRYNEYVMTRLRTSAGIDLGRLKEQFGESRLNYCMSLALPYLQDGCLCEDKERNTLSLTRKGLFVSNQIMADLMEA